MTVPWSPEPPVRASDPARLWNGQLVQRQVVDMPTGGSFTVDLARAPETIRELEAARDELTDLMAEVQRLGKIDPGTNDQVSLDAARVFGAVATGGQGSLVMAVVAGIERLDLLVNAMRQELVEYRLVDSDGRNGFDSPRG